MFLFQGFRKIKGALVSIFVFTFFVSFLSRKLLLSGDIETNPGGPEAQFEQPFYHLSLESEQNFQSIILLKYNF